MAQPLSAPCIFLPEKKDAIVTTVPDVNLFQSYGNNLCYYVFKRNCYSRFKRNCY